MGTDISNDEVSYIPQGTWLEHRRPGMRKNVTSGDILASISSVKLKCWVGLAVSNSASGLLGYMVTGCKGVAGNGLQITLKIVRFGK